MSNRPVNKNGRHILPSAPRRLGSVSDAARTVFARISAGKAPAGEAVVDEASSGKAVMGKAAVGKDATRKAASSKAPASSAPLSEAVVDKAVADKAPVVEAPVDEALAIEAPVDEPRSSDTPESTEAPQENTHSPSSSGGTGRKRRGPKLSSPKKRKRTNRDKANAAKLRESDDKKENNPPCERCIRKQIKDKEHKCWVDSKKGGKCATCIEQKEPCSADPRVTEKKQKEAKRIEEDKNTKAVARHERCERCSSEDLLCRFAVRRHGAPYDCSECLKRNEVCSNNNEKKAKDRRSMLNKAREYTQKAKDKILKPNST